MKRKLTTIFYADGVQFGAMMAADEAATMERLTRCREVMAEIFAAHDGRQVNTWGDAVIAEFASVVEAVRAAVEIQEAIAVENRDAPSGRALRFRIGVNLGDVMVDGDDFYGEGVNAAARLQTAAEPGGVMVSGTVHDLVRRQLALGFDFAGDGAVKSGEAPLEAWRIRMDGANAPPETRDAAQEATADAPAPADGDRKFNFSAPARRADGWLEWIMAQPVKVQRAAGMIAFFFAINVLFTGIATPWFLFPSLPFAIYIWRHARRQRQRAGRR